MEKTFNTKYGEVLLRTAMLETDGTNLADGIEIKIDGKLSGEVFRRIDIEEMSLEEVEELVKNNCEV